ncbi:hypothetical protein AYK25_02675 [Thermoplasmatales archaeon SM1-50]|nr:MAG: hypothetical protein AYK25_02675 [Thermoplasmatales archaeon SM1-50]
MKKQLLIIGIISILIYVGLSGCNEHNNTINTEEDRFIGTWHSTTGSPSILEFFKDGKCIYGYNGTWELTDGKLVINLISISLITTYNYTFSNNDKTLTLTFIENNFTEVWTKQ